MSLVLAEWTKIRSVWSTFWAILLTLVLSAGLGSLVALSFRSNFEAARNFDPIFVTFYSLTIGQLALVVFGVLAVTSEYSAGTIKVSLAAMPRRGALYSGKVIAVGLVALGASVITVAATFFGVQAALGPHGVRLGSPGMPTALAGAVLYLLLICLFATGVAAMLRNGIAALATLLPVLFLGSQGLGNIPGAKEVLQYLPNEAAMVILHISGPPDDPRWGRDYGPWTGIAITALWTVAALIGGYLVLRRKDA